MNKNTEVQKELKFKDGNNYILRPLAPSDDQRLQDFFYSHSQETILRRYGFSFLRMSRERASELVSVNQNHDLALAIFEVLEERQRIQAIGRYYLDNNMTSAEMAFVVAEGKRRIGMASALIERMIEIAKERKLSFLWAQVDRSNTAMLSLFKKYNTVEKMGDDFHTLRVKILIETKELRNPFLQFKK